MKWFPTDKMFCGTSTPLYNVDLGSHGNGDRYVRGNQVLPLTIRLGQGDEILHSQFEKCSDGLLILSDYMENIGHAMYAASELHSLFKRGYLTGLPSIILSNPWKSLSQFHRAIYSALPNRRILDWNPSNDFPSIADDENVKTGLNATAAADGEKIRCFERMNICRIYGAPNLPGINESYNLGNDFVVRKAWVFSLIVHLETADALNLQSTSS